MKDYKRKVRMPREDFSHVNIPDNSALVPLTKGKYSIIDREDFDRVDRINWCSCFKCNSWYAMATIKGKTTYLHNFITGLMPIDHINNNSLDNRKINLRQCDQQKNTHNTSRHSDGSSKYNGVSLYRKTGKWVSNICLNGKMIRIGTFINEKDAAKAYDKKAVELFGEYANINFK